MTTLHITNGDGAAALIKVADGIRGDVLPWRDPMQHGPMPAGLDLDALSEVRADYLAGPGDTAEARRGFRERDDQVRSAPDYEQVVLWFEHDLLDQLQMLQILDWFARHDIGDTRLELICIDAFDGYDMFRGLGQLTTEEIATLWPMRVLVTQAQLDLAQAGWAAFRSDDPRDLHGFVDGDRSALPFLAASLRRHLEEYPWTCDGLTRSERTLLQLIRGGHNEIGSLFEASMVAESHLFMGDWRLFHHLSVLSRASEPLIRAEHGGPDGAFLTLPEVDMDMKVLTRQQLYMTDAGRSVLEGDLSATDILQRDHWLGGVHVLSGPDLWMWNAESGRLVLQGR